MISNSSNDIELSIHNGHPSLNEPDCQFIFDPLFKSYSNALTVSPKLAEDVVKAFTAEEKDASSSYSSGNTFFLPANETPKCALEGLVHDIFRFHTENLKHRFDSNKSGAEWWSLVLDHNDDDDDDDDEVGAHFDADYGLEDAILIHPHIATVTYFSDVGVPTTIFEKRSEIEDFEKEIPACYVSYPRIGKHIAFDGRLLHAAPSDIVYMPRHKNHTDRAKRRKTYNESGKRISLLVNIWLNHIPIDAEPFPDSLSRQITPYYKDVKKKSMHEWLLNNKSLDEMKEVTLSAQKSNSESTPTLSFVFNDHHVKLTFDCNQETLHCVTSDAFHSTSGCMKFSFGKGILSLTIGEQVSSDEEDDESDDDSKEDNE